MNFLYIVLKFYNDSVSRTHLKTFGAARDKRQTPLSKLQSLTNKLNRGYTPRTYGYGPPERRSIFDDPFGGMANFFNVRPTPKPTPTPTHRSWGPMRPSLKTYSFMRSNVAQPCVDEQGKIRNV